MSTSPATDPLYGELPAPPSSGRSNMPNEAVAEHERFPGATDAFADRRGPDRDPIPGDRPAARGNEQPSPNRFTGLTSEGDPTKAGERAKKSAENDYAGIRRRLDRLGVRNFRLETDASTGEALFECALPYPNDPDHLRVFEARDPDELKSMLAVTEAIEAWVASGKPKKQVASDR